MSKELKAIKQGSVELGEYWVYDADDVDALIAKKDEEITRLESACRAFATERDANQDAIYELRKEIESLKASHYAEMVDAGMRERRLRRALYIVLARLFCCMRELAARNALYDDECKWDDFKTTCLKKAEEYR